MMEAYLKTAIQASLQAGKVIMKVYDSDFDVEYKDDMSPLTDADKQANTIINSYLVSTNIPVISEESRQIDFSERKHWTQCWIVDPVDGTKEFVKRNGEFTVNIALIENGIPQLGVIYIPATKELYYALVDNGKAYKIQLVSHDICIDEVLSKAQDIRPKTNSSNMLRVIGSRSHKSRETEAFINRLQSKGQTIEIVSIGSSLKFCLIAEGKADVYPRFAPTMEWDTAAGQAICNAVGIQVISRETGRPLLYNKENLLNPWFVVLKE